MTEHTPSLVTLNEVARRLAVHRQTVTRLIRKGALTPVRIPGMRHPRYDVNDLARLIEAAKVTAVDAETQTPAAPQAIGRVPE